MCPRAPFRSVSLKSSAGETGVERKKLAGGHRSLYRLGKVTPAAAGSDISRLQGVFFISPARRPLDSISQGAHCGERSVDLAGAPERRGIALSREIQYVCTHEQASARHSRRSRPQVEWTMSLVEQVHNKNC